MMIKHISIRVILISAFIISCVLLLNLTSVYAQQDVSLEIFVDSPTAYVDGIQTQIDNDNENVSPFISNDRTMIPLRFIAENLKLNVNWIDAERTVILSDATSTLNIKLVVDSNTAIVNDKNVELDSSPTLKNGRVFVPVRFIAENFSCGVEWNANNKEVIIKQERGIDIINAEVQGLFNNILNGDSFVSYYDGYADVNLFDTTNFSWMGGRIRELISILSLKNVPNVQYSDKEANEIIAKFLSEGEISDSKLDLLKTALENGETFGETATEQRLVGVYKKSEIDKISIKLFGTPLPKAESIAFPIAYGSFFFYNRVNTLDHFPVTLSYTSYYNEVSEKYLFMTDLSMLSEWSMEDYLEYYNKHYEPLKSSTQLLRAAQHNNEISLYTYHEGEFGEYSGGTGFYKGNYKNTYKKDGDNFYWVSSYGIDEK